MTDLTYKTLMALPLTTLSMIVNSDHSAKEDRLKAANALHMRARELKGAGWLCLCNHEKAEVRKAMAYDTTAEGFSAIS